MGMYLSLAGVSDATSARIHADPPLIWQIVSPEDSEAVARARGPAPRPGFFARLLGREPAPALGYLLEMVGVLRGALERVVGQGHGLRVTLT